MSTAVYEPMPDSVFHPTKEYPPFRGYFMSIEQQDAVHGRALREQKAAKEQVALLRAEAHTYSRFLRDLSDQLETNPENVGFHGEPIDVKYLRSGAMFEKLLYPTQERLTALTNALRVESSRLETANEQAASLGH